MPQIAGIDLGTNTFRLLVADLDDDGSLHPVHSENRITRLGEGFSKERRITKAAQERAITALDHFKTLLEQYPVEDMIVVATSAVRDAINQDDFCKAILAKTGFEVQVITGEEEAYCSFLGIQLALQNHSEPMVVIDIGGGSTEFITAENGAPIGLLSLKLGVVHLAESYIRSDPPSEDEIQSLKSAIDAIIKPIAYPLPEHFVLVGTAGTVTTLAAMDQEMTVYDPKKINGYRLSLNTVNRIFKYLSSLTLKERREWAGLEKGREDLIVPGMLIVKSVMEQFACNVMIVSDYGLREGVLIHHAQKMGT